MCSDDRKFWSRDFERQGEKATSERLMNWMDVDMKSCMRATAPLRSSTYPTRSGTNASTAKARLINQIPALNSLHSVWTSQEPIAGACDSHTKPMPRHFYRLIYF